MGEDVPISNQVQRRNSCLLRIPRHITTNQRQKRNKRRRRGLSEVVARETPIVIAERQADNQRHADDGDDEAYHGDQDAVFVVVARETARDHSDDFDGAAGCGV